MTAYLLPSSLSHARHEGDAPKTKNAPPYIRAGRLFGDGRRSAPRLGLSSIILDGSGVGPEYQPRQRPGMELFSAACRALRTPVGPRNS